MALMHHWLTYMNGFIILSIKGDRCEEFINLAMTKGIRLWDIKRISDRELRVRMAVGEYRNLPSLARQSRCRVRIVDKRGWPFLNRRLQNRRMLMFGGIFFLLVVYILSTFIWIVEVRPEAGPLRQVSREQVIAAARMEGLKPGARKSTIDIRVLEYNLERRLPQVAWVGVSFHGTRAEISVVEKPNFPEDEVFDRPASIIAAKDGIIKEILVINGEARVKVGDTVRQGEVLISGLVIPGEPEEKAKQGEGVVQSQPSLVRARGVVRARVWYEKELAVKLSWKREMLTGQQETLVMLRTPAGSYVIKGPIRPPFDEYRQEKKTYRLPSWRNYHFPVELIIVTYFEVLTREETLTYEEAVEAAGRQALKLLKQNVPEGVPIIQQKIIPLDKPGTGTAGVRAWLETEEDIGMTVPLNGTG